MSQTILFVILLITILAAIAGGMFLIADKNDDFLIALFMIAITSLGLAIVTLTIIDVHQNRSNEQDWRFDNCRATLSLEHQTDYDEVVRLFGDNSQQLHDYINVMCPVEGE